jgi:hypothetical protein
MQTIHYSRTKLAVMALLCCVGMPVLGLFMLATINPIGVILGVVFLVGGPISGLAVLAKLVVGGSAVVCNDRQVTLSTLWSSRTVPWDQVKAIAVERTTLRLYGLIPVSKTDHLNFQLDGTLFGSKKVSLALNLLDIDLAQANDAIHQMEQTRRAAGRGELDRPSAGQSTSGFDPLMGAPRGADFDPDAAIARYLASKSAGEAQPQADKEVGRPGQMPPPAASPQRPTFGRKVA